MVFFTCNHCGEALKKNAVDKHYSQRSCRQNCKSVSCMDCLNDFFGEEYSSHTSCVSELQKYSGKNFVPKQAKNTGKKKQETWTDMIRSILENREYCLSNRIREAFTRLQSLENVPRKKAKFQNFVSNCVKMSHALSEEVWSIIAKENARLKIQFSSKGIQYCNKTVDASTIIPMFPSKRPAIESTERREFNTDPKNKKIKVEVEVSERPFSGTNLTIPCANKIKTKKEKPIKSKRLLETESAIEASLTNGKTDVLKPKPNKDFGLFNCNDSFVKIKSKKYKPLQESKKVANSKNQNENSIKSEPCYGSACTTKLSNDTAFNWLEVIEKTIAKQSEGMTLVQLKKKVLAAYAKQMQLREVTAEYEKKFEKKFKKNLEKCFSIHITDEIVKTL